MWNFNDHRFLFRGIKLTILLKKKPQQEYVENLAFGCEFFLTEYPQKMVSINLNELCVREVLDSYYLGPALLQYPAVVLKLGESSLRLADGHLLLLRHEQLCGLLLLIQDFYHAAELDVDPQGRLLKRHLFMKTHLISHKHYNVNADLQFS